MVVRVVAMDARVVAKVIAMVSRVVARVVAMVAKILLSVNLFFSYTRAMAPQRHQPRNALWV